MNLIFSVLITLISFFYQNLNDWELKKNQDNVKVFTRSLDNGIKEFLGETILNSTMDSVFSFIMDFNKANQWMYKIKSSKIITPVNEKTFYVYFTIKMNWPLEDRDLIMEVSNIKEKKIIKIELQSQPNFIPINDKYKRIINSSSIWTLEYLDKFKTKVSLQSSSDIEGIPSWITDMFITQSPLHAMKNLQKEFN